ncbi:class I SAM-dependent methyltransferase [Kribbella monticola]|uniref:class I SAM-dependent methyltransferase n=1 Tax=Kribbella monticola TaxID=2185285 RepID=UPI000DD36017|nr:methyltransferase domain-containing protein [Kribbella monticola]
MTRPFDYDAEVPRYHVRLVAAAAVQADDHVLDVGCGTGLTTRDAAKAARSGSAVGVDINATSIDTARRLSAEEGLRNIHFEQADAQGHAFPAAGFSLAVSRFGTMFFADPEAAFANIARALRPGARFVQLVWQEREYQQWDRVIRQAFVGGDDAPLTGEAFSLADPATVEGLLTAVGFTDLEITDIREPVYYGPDAEAARDAALRLQLTQNLVAELDPTEAGQALERLLDGYEAHRTSTGIWLDTRAWLITATRR